VVKKKNPFLGWTHINSGDNTNFLSENWYCLPTYYSLIQLCYHRSLWSSSYQRVMLFFFLKKIWIVRTMISHGDCRMAWKNKHGLILQIMILTNGGDHYFWYRSKGLFESLLCEIDLRHKNQCRMRVCRLQAPMRYRFRVCRLQAPIWYRLETKFDVISATEGL